MKYTLNSCIKLVFSFIIVWCTVTWNWIFLRFHLKFRDCFKMGKATRDHVFQIYYVPRVFLGPVYVTCIFPSYIHSCSKAKCCFPCVFSTKDSIFNVRTSHDVSRLSSCWFWSRNFLYTAVIKSYSKRCFSPTLSLLSEMSFPIFLYWLSAVTDPVQHGHLSVLTDVLPTLYE